MIHWQPTLRLVRKSFQKTHPRDVIIAGVVAGLLIIFIAKALEFRVVGILQILVNQMAPIGIVAVGQTLVILTGGIDLSVGSMVALIGVLTAVFMSEFNIDPWLSVAIGLGIATLIGWVHGLLISRLKLAPFIVTFGSLSLLKGIAQVISNGSPIQLYTETFNWLSTNLFGLIPVPAILMLIVFIVMAYVLNNTRVGRYTYAIGSNENVARLSGVNVARTQQIVYAASGFLAGVAGILLMVNIQGGTINNGQDYHLLTIAAVIIGGTSLRGGTGGVWGTFVGVLLMSLVNNGLVLLSVPYLWNDAITGLIIISAALIDVQRRRLQESSPIPLATQAIPLLDSSHTLQQTVDQFTHTIGERFGVSMVRVYLHDRESGKLIEPSTQAAPEGVLVSQARTAGKLLYIHDVQRDWQHQIVPMQPQIRAAAAVPLHTEGRLIGVVEVQSTAALGEKTLETMAQLSTQIAPLLEDRWLLEGGWLTTQVRECLRSINNDAFLNQSELADWLLLDGSPSRAEKLRQILLEGIERVAPDYADEQSKAARRYQILQQTYIDEKSVDGIIHQMSLSRRQYFYDLKQAVDVVTHHVFMQRQRFKMRL